MGRTRAPLEQALRLGVIDAIATDWASALDGADLVLLACRWARWPAVMRALAPHLQPHTIVTDGGSTKSGCGRGGTAGLGDKIRPVRARPSDRRRRKERRGGAQAGSLCRQARGADAAAGKLGRGREGGAWPGKALRRKVSQLAPGASTTASSRPSATCRTCWPSPWCMTSRSARIRTSCSPFAAGGFRDFTRIASSHPEMWRDICVANRTPCCTELDAYMVELMRTRVLLAGATAPASKDVQHRPRARRLAGSLLPPGE
jgi:prephenate dehydrogenase